MFALAPPRALRSSAALHFRPEAPEPRARAWARLQVALESPALEGRAAGIAARELLHAYQLEPDSPAVLRALRAAPLEVRCELLGAPTFHSEPVEPQAPPGSLNLQRVWLAHGRSPRHRMSEPVRAELLRAFADPGLEYRMVCYLLDELEATDEGRELLLRARAECKSAEVRGEIGRVCKVRDETEAYWEEPDEEDDGDED